MNPFIKAIAGNTIEQETEKAVKGAQQVFKFQLDKTVKEAVNSAKSEWAKETAKSIVKEVRKKTFVTTTGTKPFEAKEVPMNKNWSMLEQLYSNAPGAVQCVDRIRDSVLGSGYTIEKDGDTGGTKKDLKTLTTFFDKPNPDETIEDIVGNGIINYLEYGNWFFEEVPNKKGDKLSEIYNLDTTKMKILVDDAQRKAGVNIIKGYERTTETGTRIVYNAEEVTLIKRPDPRGLVWGRAVLEDDEATLQLLIEALIYNINILKNGGRPPLQLILPDDSDEADAEAVNAFWEKNYTGPENAGKTLITFKGAKAQPLGITPQDMRYLNLLQYGVRAVAGQFGVPLIIIGIPEGTNRATASEVRRQFYLSKIFPLRDMIAKRLTREIIQERFGISGWKFTFKSAGLEESEATRRDTMTAWTKGLMSWNDARVKIGLEPVNIEWANKYFLLGTKNDSLIEIKNAIITEVAKPPKPKPGVPPFGNAPKPGKAPNAGAAPDAGNIAGPNEAGQGADAQPK